MNCEPHFRSVLDSQQVRAVLERHGLDRTETWSEGRFRNGGMKVYRDAWMIPMPAQGIEGLNVHFEARRPGELQVDIEVFPYEGSIEKNAARLEELRRHMEVKQVLIETIRAELSTDAASVQRLGVSTKGLRNPAVPSTLCAVKFLSEHGENTTVEADAAFAARVVDHATPILDRIIQRLRP